MKKKVRTNPWLFTIVGLGIFLRLFYIVTTNVSNLGQYDLGGVVLDENIMNGHIGYIYYLFTYKQIPNFDPLSVYEFYQPPTHYIISAIWLYIVSLFTSSQTIQTELMQVIPFIWSVLSMFVVYKITKEWDLNDRGTNLVMATIALNPGVIMLSGSINNDNMSYLFHFIVILCAIRWYKNRSIKNIIILALSIGVGMLTKLSTGLVAIPVAFMFLYVFIEEWVIEKRFPVKRMLNYILFGVICIPIGLFWVLRCYIRFNVPINYVGTLSDETWGYVGDYSFVSRMFPPNPLVLLKNMAHGGIGYSQNVWVQMIRTSSCTEADMANFPMWAKLSIVLMMGLVFVFALISFIGFVRSFICGKKETYPVLDRGLRWFWIIAYAAVVYSYFSFAYKFPQQCSMNFRYIVPVLMYPAVGLSLASQKDCLENRKVLKLIENIAIAAYAIGSSALILTWFTYTQI